MVYTNIITGTPSKVLFLVFKRFLFLEGLWKHPILFIYFFDVTYLGCVTVTCSLYVLNTYWYKYSLDFLLYHFQHTKFWIIGTIDNTKQARLETFFYNYLDPLLTFFKTKLGHGCQLFFCNMCRTRNF